jgi:thiol-disulfide isomerase/thioredoxin
MKNILLLIISIFLIVSACRGKNPLHDAAIISGKIEGLESAKFQVSRYGERPVAAEVLEDGSFHIRVILDEPGYLSIWSGETYFVVYMSPGDSLHFSADMEDFFHQFRFEGDKAREAEYLHRVHYFLKETGLGDMKQLGRYGKERYFEVKDSLFGELRLIFEEMKLQKGIDPDFVELEEAFFEYYDINLDLYYPMYHMDAYQIRDHRDVDFPLEETLRRIEELDYSNPLMVRQPYFRFLLDQKVDEKVSSLRKEYPELKELKNPNLTLRMMAADSLFEVPEVRDYVKFFHLSMNVENDGPERFRELIDTFLKYNSVPSYENRLRRLIKTWEELDPGREIPDFSFTNPEGKEVRLSQFLGNLLYIDVWATWCGPCIAEHPHWDKLQEEYQGKEIVFVSISVDQSRDAWNNMLKEKGMTGHHWFAENAWHSEIATHFMIRGIPRFILLDREGKVINASATRPSGKIRELIDQHL